MLDCCRLMKTPGKSESDMQAVIARRPTSLSCTLNLGVVDFYPAISGKEGAARHLMAKWGVGPAHTGFLCDDDNDLALAAIVAKAFLPSITAVRRVKALDIGQFSSWFWGVDQDMLGGCVWWGLLLWMLLHGKGRYAVWLAHAVRLPCNVHSSRPTGCYTTVLAGSTLCLL